MYRGGFTQRHVAQQVGLGEPALSQMLSGKRPLSLGFLLALERVFGVAARPWWLKQAEYELGQARLQQQP